MFRSCKSTSSCLVINTLCVYPFYITCQNHKRITQFCFICRGSLVHFMRNRIEHLQSPGAPTQNTHTHLSHTANCTNSNGTHEKHEPYFITQIPLKSLIVARTSPAAEVEQPAPLLAAVFRKGRAQTLPSQADFPSLSRKSHEHPLRVLYGPVLSFLLLSPRGAMATFSCLFNDCG